MPLTNLIGTAKITAAALTGVALGVATDANPATISEVTHITLGYAVAVATPVVLVAWYLSGKLTKIVDRLDRLESIIKNLPGVKLAERQAHMKELRDEGD